MSPYGKAAQWTDVVRRGSKFPSLTACLILQLALLASAQFQSKPDAQATPGARSPSGDAEPTSVEGWLQLARSQLDDGRLIQAERSARAALDLDPDQGQAFAILAAVMDRLDQKLGQREVADLPHSGPGQWIRGKVVIGPVPGQPGRYTAYSGKSAIVYATRAHDLGVRDAELLIQLGRLWAQAGCWELADRFNESVDAGDLADPIKRADFHIQRARALLELDRFAEALDQVKAANQAAGRGVASWIDTMLEIAERYSARGDVDNYLHCLATAADSQPADAILRLRYADALWSAGRTQAAAPEYRRVLDLDPRCARSEQVLQRILDVRPVE